MVLADFLSEWYVWIKAFHVMAVIAWMAGLFYLPRLFVYHCIAGQEGETHELLKVMEYKLYRYIMVPAMYASWAAGLSMIAVLGLSDIWLHVKLTMVVALTGFHFLLAHHKNQFRDGSNRRAEKYFRMINEIPTLLMVVIVIMVIVKPF